MNQQTEQALRMAIEEQIDLMDGWAKAYPESIFSPVTDEEIKELEKYKKHLGMRISAQMGRHMGKHFEQVIKLLEKCKEALEQPEQEPVGWWCKGETLDESDYYPAADFPDLDTTNCIPLYTRPTKPLSDDEILDLSVKYDCHDLMKETNLVEFARAIEDKLMEKNK